MLYRKIAKLSKLIGSILALNHLSTCFNKVILSYRSKFLLFFFFFFFCDFITDLLQCVVLSSTYYGVIVLSWYNNEQFKKQNIVDWTNTSNHDH